MSKLSPPKPQGTPAKLKVVRRTIPIAFVASALFSFSHTVNALSCSTNADAWNTGYTVNVTVTNDSNSTINGWQVTLNHSQTPNVTGSWNADTSTSGNSVFASNVTWNAELAAGQSTTFGYQGNHNGNFQAPSCVGDGITPPTGTPVPTPTSSPSQTPSPTPEPGSTRVVLQENATGFCGVDGSIDSNHSGYSGSGFANTTNAQGSAITWSVTVGESGNYQLQWRYANASGGNRSANIEVNGSVQANVDLNETGAWSNWQDSAAITVFLNTGTNTLRAVADTVGGLANIDRLTITGSSVSARNCDNPVTPAPTQAPPPTTAPTSTPTPPPTNGDCPFELVGWATTNGGTTGGGNVSPTVVNNDSDLRNALSGSTPRVVHFSGTIDTGSSSVTIGSNKTLRGTNRNATISGGLSVSGSNVIVQNFTLQGKGYGGNPADAINGDGNNIWFDHLNVLEGGDGLLDLVNGADRITTSWNKFSYTDPNHGHRLSLLFGNSSDKCDLDGGRQRHTIHHNWFGNLVRSRMPRLYFGQAHIFNNYYHSPGNNYAIGVGTWASALIQNNYFKDVNDPHRRQNEYPTYIEATGNIYDGTSGARDNGPNAIGTMPDRFAGSSCHANLADPGQWNPPYPYNLDPASSIPELVQRCAGPQ